MYSFDGKQLVAYPRFKESNNYIAADTVAELDLSVFNYCKNLLSVYVHDSIIKLTDTYYREDIIVYCGKSSAPDEWKLYLKSGNYRFGVTLDEYLAIIGEQT